MSNRCATHRLPGHTFPCIIIDAVGCRFTCVCLSRRFLLLEETTQQVRENDERATSHAHRQTQMHTLRSVMMKSLLRQRQSLANHKGQQDVPIKAITNKYFSNNLSVQARP